MEEKVSYVALNSANVRVSNANDSEKVFDIEANANVTNNSVSSVDSGVVNDGSVQVATFHSYGDNNVTISYMNVDASKQCAITEAVNAFLEAVRTKVAEEMPLSV